VAKDLTTTTTPNTNTNQSNQ